MKIEIHKIPKPTTINIGRPVKLNLAKLAIANIIVPYAPNTSSINEPEIPGSSIALEAQTPAIKYLIIRLKDN